MPIRFAFILCANSIISCTLVHLQYPSYSTSALAIIMALLLDSSYFSNAHNLSLSSKFVVRQNSGYVRFLYLQFCVPQSTQLCSFFISFSMLSIYLNFADGKSTLFISYLYHYFVICLNINTR